MGDGKECNKKVSEQGDGTYRCEKCMRNKNDFKWRIMLQLNMADCSENNWASCFQVEYSHLSSPSVSMKEKIINFLLFSFMLLIESFNFNQLLIVYH